MSKRFTLPVEVDEEDNYFITLPQEILDEMGWYEGITLDWSEDIDGSIILKNPKTPKKSA